MHTVNEDTNFINTLSSPSLKVLELLLLLISQGAFLRICQQWLLNLVTVAEVWPAPVGFI